MIGLIRRWPNAILRGLNQGGNRRFSLSGRL